MLISKFLNSDVEEQIACIEKQYNITLPLQYKNFLNKYNGGYTPKTKFRVGKLSSDLQGFYGVGDVKKSLNHIELEEWIENNVLPIAYDSFGNYIVAGLSEDGAGKIYFSDHEKEYPLQYIAENLQDFLKCCNSEKISETTRYSIKEREDRLIARGRGHIITDDLRKMWQDEINKYGDMVQEEVFL